MNKCGKPYKVGAGIPIPKHARYALLYWDTVIYLTTKQAAENTKGKLDYYQAEDARIIPVSQRRN